MTDTPRLAPTPDAGQGLRLMLDVREVRDRTLLRMIASLPALLGGLWLLWIADSLLLRGLALAGVVFSAIWVSLARRNIRQVASAGEHYLDIEDRGLTLRNGTQSRSLAWSEVEAVEIDEDRLAVRVRVRGADSLLVEPQYGELGLRELAETIERGRVHAGMGIVTPSPAGVRSPQS
jgi:hypothetical protein